MCEHVRLEVGALGKPLVAAVVGADKGPAARVDSNVSAQVKVKAKLFSAALKWTL